VLNVSESTDGQSYFSRLAACLPKGDLDWPLLIAIRTQSTRSARAICLSLCILPVVLYLLAVGVWFWFAFGYTGLATRGVAVTAILASTAFFLAIPYVVGRKLKAQLTLSVKGTAYLAGAVWCPGEFAPSFDDPPLAWLDWIARRSNWVLPLTVAVGYLYLLLNGLITRLYHPLIHLAASPDLDPLRLDTPPTAGQIEKAIPTVQSIVNVFVQRTTVFTATATALTGAAIFMANRWAREARYPRIAIKAHARRGIARARLQDIWQGEGGWEGIVDFRFIDGSPMLVRFPLSMLAPQKPGKLSMVPFYRIKVQNNVRAALRVATIVFAVFSISSLISVLNEFNTRTDNYRSVVRTASIAGPAPDRIKATSALYTVDSLKSTVNTSTILIIVSLVAVIIGVLSAGLTLKQRRLRPVRIRGEDTIVQCWLIGFTYSGAHWRAIVSTRKNGLRGATVVAVEELIGG
jgi:hypothetical protein